MNIIYHPPPRHAVAGGTAHSFIGLKVSLAEVAFRASGAMRWAQAGAGGWRLDEVVQEQREKDGRRRVEHSREHLASREQLDWLVPRVATNGRAWNVQLQTHLIAICFLPCLSRL